VVNTGSRAPPLYRRGPTLRRESRREDRPRRAIDGCIWAGTTLLPGAAELVKGLREAGCRVVYMPNSSRELAASISGKLTTIWVGPEGNSPGEGRADLVIRSLAELREL
jgi:hypothetical protein